ncbi:unnamed protein product [Alternaria alternata]
MLLNPRTLALAALFSTLVTGRPFDSPKPRDVGRRDKSYSVVNVGGDSSTPAPAIATSVIETTKTVEVVAGASTDNQLQLEQRIEVFVFVNTRSNNDVDVDSGRIFINSHSISTPIETPKPIFVTVTISKGDGPTEYYDDGMWHTHYRIKTFEAAAVVTAAP